MIRSDPATDATNKAAPIAAPIAMFAPVLLFFTDTVRTSESAIGASHYGNLARITRGLLPADQAVPLDPRIADDHVAAGIQRHPDLGFAR